MKNIVITENAPAAIGPYSQGIITGNLVFTSGQIPLDPRTGVIPLTIEEQAELSLNNLRAVLEAAGSSLEKTVKVTIFLSDIHDFAAVNEVYRTFFESDYPCRSCVEVARLPRDVKIEIEAIALA